MAEFMPTFWIVLTGMLVAASCALLGTFLVLRKMSLLGDALSHAVLPGIAIAFLLSGSRAVWPMFVGAALFGLLTTALVELLHRHWQVQEDASIGVVFTALFAMGVVLISYYAGQVDLDQECVLYGEIAFTPWDTLILDGVDYGPRPVWILSAVLIMNLVLVGLLYKEFVITSFDPALAVALGFSASVLHYLLMAAVSITTVASFESVGAILVVAMFIVPGAAAWLWTDRLRVMLALSVLFGMLSAVLGYAFASVVDSSIAGAMVVMIGAIFLVSLVFAPRQGLLGRLWQRLRLSLQIAEDHVLLELIREQEDHARDSLTLGRVHQVMGVWRGLANLALYRLRSRQYIQVASGTVALGAMGRHEALKLLGRHRLWESYLSQLGVAEDHVHRPADDIEHFIDDALHDRIRKELPDVDIDPHGKAIPKTNGNNKK